MSRPALSTFFPNFYVPFVHVVERHLHTSLSVSSCTISLLVAASQSHSTEAGSSILPSSKAHACVVLTLILACFYCETRCGTLGQCTQVEVKESVAWKWIVRASMPALIHTSSDDRSAVSLQCMQQTWQNLDSVVEKPEVTVRRDLLVGTVGNRAFTTRRESLFQTASKNATRVTLAEH